MVWTQRQLASTVFNELNLNQQRMRLTDNDLGSHTRATGSRASLHGQTWMGLCLVGADLLATDGGEERESGKGDRPVHVVRRWKELLDLKRPS